MTGTPITVDFNPGCRVHLPHTTDAYHVLIRDLDTGHIVTDTHSHGGLVQTAKKFFIRYGVQVRQNDVTIYRTEFDARDRVVLIKFAIGTLGDTLAWFPYCVRFQAQHDCRLVCLMDPRISPLYAASYPHITFIGPDDVAEWEAKAYATYALFIFFGDEERNDSPVDYRFAGLHRNAGYILGTSLAELVPDVVLPDETRPIAEKYACIAIQASSQCKYWNNPNGWDEVVGYLKGRGYRVICIDRNSCWGSDPHWNRIPPGAEDETGERPLAERARWLRHASLFVGLSSGLSWLAWTMHCPVVMISGFTHPSNEFHTPFRVWNPAVCSGCWNDIRYEWGQGWIWCPRHLGTDRELECSKKITGQQVIEAVARCIADRRKHRFRKSGHPVNTLASAIQRLS